MARWYEAENKVMRRGFGGALKPTNVPHACESSEDATELGFGICDSISHRTTRMRIERCENIQRPPRVVPYSGPVIRMASNANVTHHRGRGE